MKRTHKMVNLATVLVLLVSLGDAMGGLALSKDTIPNINGIEAVKESKVVTGVDASMMLAGNWREVSEVVDGDPGGDIIPADRKIDWSYSGIPGGIPKRTYVCATINSAVYGNGSTDATNAIQNALDSCPDGQVVYLPQGTYIVNSTIHLYDYDTLRGAGPGKTILKHVGGYLRSIVDMRGTIYYQLASLHKTYDVLQADKDAKVITLSSTSGIKPGDIILINQLNDNAIVDPMGVEGKCTYCGYEGGDRTLGQLAEVTAVAGNQVTLNLPLHWTYSTALDPWAYQVDAYAMVRHAGLEDLTLTQDNPEVEFVIEMDGAQYSWVKNVEIKNIQRRGMWIIDSLQNEIRECYVHIGIDGYGRDRGYGIFLDVHSSNNLVEDNILSTIDGGGIMTGGGASGNVLAYNYLHDILFDDPWWLIASPSINHNPHPKMNLWEEDIGYKAEADIIHGSSSHNTIFRSQMKGWQSDSITTRNNAVEIAAKNTYMTVIGSVLGTPGKSNRYQVLPGEPYDDWSENAIWVLGVGSGVKDANVVATLLRHGNYDYVTNSVVWDPKISKHDLPDSLYLNGMPEWWCRETPWPPIGPDVVGYFNDIPAKRRFEGLPCTPTSEITLRGIPANEGIRLTWEVNASLPVISTWEISYDGPPGDQFSPITGLPASTRAYTLTGMTNYILYTITLNAKLNSTPFLTDTVSVMPTDISIHLPVAIKGP
jgi:hypothetical protein